MTRALPLLALLAACCTTSSTGTTWRAGDAITEQRLTADVQRASTATVRKAREWHAERCPEHAERLRSMPYEVTVYGTKMQPAAGMAHGVKSATVVWLPHEGPERPGNLGAHEFGHAALIYCGDGTEHHEWMAKHGYQW